MPDSNSGKGFRTYRGGHAGNDPEAARFDFSAAKAGVATPTRPTPEGMPAPDMRPPAPPTSPPVVAAPGRAPKPPGRRRIGWKRGILLGVGAVVLVLTVWVYLGYRAFSNEVSRANARLGQSARSALTPSGSILFHAQNTLVMGSDSRGGSATGDITDGARADSILILRTNPSKHLVSMLSIPRDLNVPIPGHGVNKINAAFAYGGPKLLIRTINHLTGLKINHMVLVDFTGFKDLIDTVGGVTLDNPTKVISSQPFGGYYWHFKRGTIHLDGAHALAYARIRHTTNPRDSDITRTERQQRVMAALAHKLVSPWNIFNLPTIGRAIAEPLTTDLTANDFLELGWVKERAGRTLECHLGGTPEIIGGEDVLASSPQNAAVLGMFLGTQAPQHAAKGNLYGPGCSIH